MISLLYIPSLDMTVSIKFDKEKFNFYVEFIPESEYNDEIVKNEVEKIIVKMLEEVST